MALSASEQARLNGLFHQRNELEGILLMLKERARSGKSKHHGETQYMAEATQKRLNEVLNQIRKLTAKR